MRRMNTVAELSDLEGEKDLELLDFQIHWGSVEHYFHFVFGLVIPLLSFLLEAKNKGKEKLYLVRSCGPMDRLLEELGLSELLIIPRKVHSKLVSENRYPTKRITGKDYKGGEGNYRSEDFASIRQYLCDRLQPKEKVIGEPILIDRGAPPPFYSSKDCELKTSARQRRSIPNIEQLRSDVQTLCGNCFLYYLENLSLQEQATVFGSAPLVIAQHGAALANILWMSRGAGVIEILPRGLPHTRSTLFSELSGAFGLHYWLVPQEGDHAPVDSSVFQSVLEIAWGSLPRS